MKGNVHIYNFMSLIYITRYNTLEAYVQNYCIRKRGIGSDINYLTFFAEDLFALYLIEQYPHKTIKYNNLICFQIQMPKLSNSQAPGFQNIN